MPRAVSGGGNPASVVHHEAELRVEPLATAFPVSQAQAWGFDSNAHQEVTGLSRVQESKLLVNLKGLEADCMSRECKANDGVVPKGSSASHASAALRCAAVAIAEEQHAQGVLCPKDVKSEVPKPQDGSYDPGYIIDTLGKAAERAEAVSAETGDQLVHKVAANLKAAQEHAAVAVTAVQADA